jgi:hypothetical protein
MDVQKCRGCRHIAGLFRAVPWRADLATALSRYLTAVTEMALSQWSEFGADDAALDDALSRCDVRGCLRDGS